MAGPGYLGKKEVGRSSRKCKLLLIEALAWRGDSLFTLGAAIVAAVPTFVEA